MVEYLQGRGFNRAQAYAPHLGARMCLITLTDYWTSRSSKILSPKRSFRWAIARCTEAGCSNLGRVILRHFDAGGRPMENREFCNAHAKVRINCDRAAGLRVYDDHSG
jgi:hypothetical protein